MRCVNVSAKGSITLELTSLLLAVTPEKVVVETTTKVLLPNGSKTLNTSSTDIQSSEPTSPDDGKVSEEVIRVAGKDLRATLTDRSGDSPDGPIHSRIWTSPDVPGLSARLEITSGVGDTKRTSHFEVTAISLK